MQLLKHDFLTFIYVIFPVVSVLMSVFLVVFGFLPSRRGHEYIDADALPVFIGLSIAVLMVFLPLLILRIRRFKSILRNGIKIKGKIVNIYFHKDRGKITFQYRINNENIIKSMMIMKSKVTESIMINDEVDVYVDKSSKMKALIVKLYT